MINPEGMLQELDEQQSRNTAAADSDVAFYGPLLLLSFVGDVAAIASGKGSDTTGFHTSEIAHHMETSAIGHESASQSIASQRQLWSNVALRRNTVFPGNGTGGLVYLPIDRNARFVWVFVRRVGGPALPFCFEQTVKEVK